jgi:ABC-type uncharacterized transport system substrate-binding protein
VRRRKFIVVFGAAAAWPLAGDAQQSERIRRVGVLMPWSENDPVAQASVNAFAQALESLGWVEGKNIRIDYRFAAGDPTLLKTYASELVVPSPQVILASTPQAVAAVRQQTKTIPIVFVLVVDRVFGWLLNREVGRAGASQDAVDVGCRLRVHVGYVDEVGDQATRSVSALPIVVLLIKLP